MYNSEIRVPDRRKSYASKIKQFHEVDLFKNVILKTWKQMVILKKPGAKHVIYLSLH